MTARGRILVAAALLVVPHAAAHAGHDGAWGVAHIGAAAAWAAGATGAGVRVAIVDTGIDAAHPLLAGAIDWSVSACPLDRDVLDRTGHGTHVAGIVRQVAPDARLYVVKALGAAGDLASCTGWSDLGEVAGVRAHVVGAIRLAARGPDGALGTPDDADVVLAAIEIALPVGAVPALVGGPDPFADLAASGVVVVAAAGNARAQPGVTWPAAEPSVVAVGAIGEFEIREQVRAGPFSTDPTVSPDEAPFDGRDWIADYSSNGLRDADDATIGVGEIELVAPGTRIASAHLRGGTEERTGTSQAAAHAAGVAALAASAGARDVRAAMRCAAVDLAWRGKLTAPGYDASSGHGWPDGRRLEGCRQAER